MSDVGYERSVKSDQDPSEILRFSEMKFPSEICTPGGFKIFCNKPGAWRKSQRNLCEILDFSKMKFLVENDR